MIETIQVRFARIARFVERIEEWTISSSLRYSCRIFNFFEIGILSEYEIEVSSIVEIFLIFLNEMWQKKI